MDYKFYYDNNNGQDDYGLKYINNEHASTIVVINGLAITAGSKPNFLANIGKEQPINFETITVKINVKIPHKPQTGKINF